ncbi:hypothetical protein KSC_016920 [Ktedonobacter sp. SOSP1-52]|uniref:hypothetical protein n=1 Tax=Ktedonobacter sp. SOSP1-52 TaxID=2778366 RepID=UPI001916AEED|nr:hypothetical protein [Ktedonobacter sp. SOSP1-52]GHO62800.1 hypothetical protein KSC_016920 [Ktedonobacter sp. SOSP1-52]
MSSLFPDPQDRPASYDRFLQAYEGGSPPWDTKITPPELVAEVEGPQARQGFSSCTSSTLASTSS